MPSKLLCFTAEESNSTISIIKGSSLAQNISLLYSTDGINWLDYEIDQVITLPNIGDKVHFKAKTQNETFHYYYFVSTNKMSASGNIQYLLDNTGERMDVPRDCYDYLFLKFPRLTQAPELPATELAYHCYDAMFAGTQITRAPELPATQLAEGCYLWMFVNCKSLESAELPAAQLARRCYLQMFRGCTKLKEIKVNFNEWRDDIDSTSNWVLYVPPGGSFYCPKELPIEFSENGIPPGWRVNPVQKIYINKQPVIKPYLNGKIGKIYVGTRRVY